MAAARDGLRARLGTSREAGDSVVVLGFDEIEALDGPLPAPAAHRKSWWVASGSSQSRAWTEAGYAVDTVGFAARRVAFRLDA